MAYRLRWKRRRLLYRALRKRRQLMPLADRTATIRGSDVLLFCTVRNEMQRLPHFMDHYRRLGVGHFLFVDNGSDDGSADWLAQQDDVSLWRAAASYKLSRFGMDWLTALMMRHGHGRWCLTVDADEILVYPNWETRPLAALTDWLDGSGQVSMGALMLDMYPEGRLGETAYRQGDDPFRVLTHFDGGNYMIQRQEPHWNLWIQGGARARAFFATEPRRAPTLNKVPLVKWNRRFVYVTSTHHALPRRLNATYDESGGEKLSGVLLHTKFLPSIVTRSVEEKQRGEHFANSSLYEGYYDTLATAPRLMCDHSSPYLGWRQLEAMGLMSRGTWI